MKTTRITTVCALLLALTVALPSFSQTPAPSPGPSQAKLIGKLCVALLTSFKYVPSQYHRYTEAVFLPHRTLARRANFVVSGQPWSSKKTGIEVADRLESFDRELSNAGFAIPRFTKVIINDRPLLPSTGPAAFPLPTFHAQHLKSGFVINMSPIGYETTPVTNDCVIAHERTHTVMFENYSYRSVPNSRPIFQEALADFFPAHFLGRTYNPFGRKDFRDVATMSWADGHISTYSSAAETGHHNASLMLSNFLWRVRAHIGQTRMTFLLKPLMDALASYKIPDHDFVEDKNKSQSSLYFLMAVTEREVQVRYPDIYFSPVMDDYMSALDINPGHYRKFAQSLGEPGEVEVRKSYDKVALTFCYLGASFCAYLELLVVKDLVRILDWMF